MSQVILKMCLIEERNGAREVPCYRCGAKIGRREPMAVSVAHLPSIYWCERCWREAKDTETLVVVEEVKP